MKYVMLAVVATIGAYALLTIAGAFLWAISEELEDIRELLFAYADAIRVERMRKGLVILPQYEAYLKQEPSPLYSGLRQEDAANAWLTYADPQGTNRDTMQTLFSVLQPITKPPLAVTKTLTGLPEEGVVGVLSTLSTPAKGIASSSWVRINTGTEP